MRRRLVHHVARQRGSRVAARGARAAAGKTGRRISSLCITRHIGTPRVGGPRGPPRSRLRGGPECRDRIPLAHGNYDQLAALAADLVRRQVTVIVAGGNVAALAVKKTTATIPIVFTSGADPVKSGLVASLSRPEGNLTGVSLLAVEMATKRLELIRDLLPHARAVAMIVNPDYSGAEAEMADVEAAGRTIGIKAHKVTARNALDINTAFEAIGGLHVDAFMVGTDGFFITRRHQLAALAARHSTPASTHFLTSQRPAAS